MAHADIFQKITSSSPKVESKKTNQDDSALLETVKLACKQIIEMREIIDLQTNEINDLKDLLANIIEKTNENSGNIKMALIDQKDISKHLRQLKAAVSSETIMPASQSKAITQVASARPSAIKTDALKAKLAKQEAISQQAPADTNAIARKYYSNYSSSTVVNQDAINKEQEALEAVIPMRAEKVANEFIFGRMPKLLKLT